MTEVSLARLRTKLVHISPRLKRTFWKRWYQYLAQGFSQADWTFMNYGYASVEPDVTPLPLRPEDEPDRYYIQLYDQVASPVNLKGLKVLEVGSGRGGGSSYLARYKLPVSIVGLDFSANAVALSQKRHALSNLSFQQGDAEALPFASETMDAIINVESSHCYGSMPNFLYQVHRVLKPGGYFLWADLRPREELDRLRQQFLTSHLVVRQERDITSQVLQALDLMSDHKDTIIKANVPKFLLPSFQGFAGVKGTRVYEALRDDKMAYLIKTCQKSSK